MASTGKIKVNFGFGDETARQVEIGPFAVDAAAITNAKANIKAFDPATVQGLYLSDGGATCTGVVSATVVTTEDTEINLNVTENEGE